MNEESLSRVGPQHPTTKKEVHVTIWSTNPSHAWRYQTVVSPWGLLCGETAHRLASFVKWTYVNMYNLRDIKQLKYCLQRHMH